MTALSSPAMSKLWALLAGIGLVVALAAPAGAADSHTIRGTFDIHGDTNTGLETGDIFVNGDSCTGDGGYSDIEPGTTVVIRNDRNRVIATGELGSGDANVPGGACRFKFAIKVPDSPFYGIEVSHRGSLTYSKKKLEKAKWKVALSIGS